MGEIRGIDFCLGLISFSWVFAGWLGDNGPYAFYVCMGGAMTTVALWALIRRLAQPTHEGGEP